MKKYCLQNKFLSVSVMPSLGGKSISIFHKEKQFELLAQKTPRFFEEGCENGTFVNSAAYGFDDAFPCVSEGEIEVGGRIITYPDHGEIWSLPMEVTDWNQNRQELSLTCTSKILPYQYEKKISLQGQSVKYAYRITNTGKVDIPCIWTFHCLVRYEEDMKLLFPPKGDCFVNVLDSNVLGEKEREYSIENTNIYAFDRVPNSASNSMEKYYLKEEVTEGCCGYEYPTQGICCTLKYDPKKLPYLGFFVTAGGLKGDYNCALEPSDGYYDSVQRGLANKKCHILYAGQVKEFEIEMEIECKG